MDTFKKKNWYLPPVGRKETKKHGYEETSGACVLRCVCVCGWVGGGGGETGVYLTGRISNGQNMMTSSPNCWLLQFSTWRGVREGRGRRRRDRRVKHCCVWFHATLLYDSSSFSLCVRNGRWFSFVYSKFRIGLNWFRVTKKRPVFNQSAVGIGNGNTAEGRAACTVARLPSGSHRARSAALQLWIESKFESYIHSDTLKTMLSRRMI